LHRAGGLGVPHNGDSAGRASRCQLHDTEVLTGPVIDKKLKTSLLRVEVLGSVYVCDRCHHEFEGPVHDHILAIGASTFLAAGSDGCRTGPSALPALRLTRVFVPA